MLKQFAWTSGYQEEEEKEEKDEKDVEEETACTQCMLNRNSLRRDIIR